MGKILDKIEERVDNALFKLSTTEVVSASEQVQSPIDASVSTLASRPWYKKIGQNQYIRFGTNDDIPDVLSNLIGKSAMHAGIIERKSKMIAGKELTFKAKGKGASAQLELDVFLRNAGGKNKSLNKEWKKGCYNYSAYGAAIFLVTFKSKGQLIGFQSIHPRNIRMGMPNKQGIVDTVVWRPVFKPVTTPIFPIQELVYPLYDKDSNAKQQIIYISNPESDVPFYGVPNYIGAFNFIEADYEFGNTIKNAARNGFSPKVLASFIGRSMSEEQKREESLKLKANFQGSDGDNMIVSWVRRKEDVPEFTPLNVENLDRTISTMAELNDAKILTAHSVIAPSLFGVVVSSKLGVSGSELRDAYAILMSSEIIPTRELILEQIKYLFENTQYNGATIDVTDQDLMQFESRGGTNGGNTTTKVANPSNTQSNA